jgi:hypothetical protein
VLNERRRYDSYLQAPPVSSVVAEVPLNFSNGSAQTPPKKKAASPPPPAGHSLAPLTQTPTPCI